MTFPLGSLRRDGSESTAPAARASSTSSWRAQLALLIGAVAWILGVLALSTHSGADPGFSTSGSGGSI
ncbi:MAG: hypothetical protein M3R22_07605, partial [Pseudomonadota bacterium]|nr:hypothetical protein [Pseudomonadota bacterium]